jgi:hypothetical protein
MRGQPLETQRETLEVRKPCLAEIIFIIVMIAFVASGRWVLQRMP